MNKEIEIEEALRVAEEHIKEHGLEIQLKDAECVSEDDKLKLKYRFTVKDGKPVDTDVLREIIREIAFVFRVRIEFSQI